MALAFDPNLVNQLNDAKKKKKSYLEDLVSPIPDLAGRPLDLPKRPAIPDLAGKPLDLPKRPAIAGTGISSPGFEVRDASGTGRTMMTDKFDTRTDTNPGYLGPGISSMMTNPNQFPISQEIARFAQGSPPSSKYDTYADVPVDRIPGGSPTPTPLRRPSEEPIPLAGGPRDPATLPMPRLNAIPNDSSMAPPQQGLAYPVSQGPLPPVTANGPSQFGQANYFYRSPGQDGASNPDGSPVVTMLTPPPPRMYPDPNAPVAHGQNRNRTFGDGATDYARGILAIGRQASAARNRGKDIDTANANTRHTLELAQKAREHQAEMQNRMHVAEVGSRMKVLTDPITGAAVSAVTTERDAQGNLVPKVTHFEDQGANAGKVQPPPPIGATNGNPLPHPISIGEMKAREGMVRRGELRGKFYLDANGRVHQYM